MGSTGGATFHLAPEGGGHAPLLAGDPDFEPVWIVVAAISLVDMTALKGDAEPFLQTRQHGPQRMPVIRVAVMGLGIQHELAALGLGDGRDDRDLAAELIGRPGLALADAFHFGRVQRINLRSALPLILRLHAGGQHEQAVELAFQPRMAVDLAPYVADHGPDGCVKT
jgi:hypothetical protein